MDAIIGAACASETRALCAREADLLALVATRATTHDDDRVRQRRQRVRECLADHADDLSADCVSALVGNVATEHSALPEAAADDEKEEEVPSGEHPAQDKDAVATPQDEEATKASATNEEPAAPPQKPVIVKLPPKEYTAAPLSVAQPEARPLVPQPFQPQPQPQYVQTSGDMETGIEVRIILVNHPGQAVAAAPPATPTYIRIGGDAAQHVDGDNAGAVATTAATAGFAMSPWLWVLVLPFMCIGMYVSAVQTIAFVRRRRDVVYRVGAAQYQPIPSSLSATKQ